jgi:hypothetical protein
MPRSAHAIGMPLCGGVWRYCAPERKMMVPRVNCSCPPAELMSRFHEKHGLSSVRQRKLLLLIRWAKELFGLKFWIRVDLGSKNMQRQLS